MAKPPVSYTQDQFNDLSLNTREIQAFDIDDDGYVIKRTSAKGEFTASGLKNAGNTEEVTVSSGGWSALPASALPDRNSILVQNQGASNIKINTSDSPAGYVGILLGTNGSLQIDITDAIDLYAKSETGSVTVVVMEFS